MPAFALTMAMVLAMAGACSSSGSSSCDQAANLLIACYSPCGSGTSGPGSRPTAGRAQCEASIRSMVVADCQRNLGLGGGGAGSSSASQPRLSVSSSGYRSSGSAAALRHGYQCAAKATTCLDFDRCVDIR